MKPSSHARRSEPGPRAANPPTPQGANNPTDSSSQVAPGVRDQESIRHPPHPARTARLNTTPPNRNPEPATTLRWAIKRRGTGPNSGGRRIIRQLPVKRTSPDLRMRSQNPIPRPSQKRLLTIGRIPAQKLTYPGRQGAAADDRAKTPTLRPWRPECSSSIERLRGNDRAPRADRPGCSVQRRPRIAGTEC